MRKTLGFSCLLLLALAAFAQSPTAYYLGNTVTSLSAVSASTVGSVFVVNSGGAVKSFTWTSIITGGTAGAISVNLEGSIDNSFWIVLDNSTNTSGEGRHVVNKPVNYFRCNLISFTASGTTETCKVMAVQ